MTHQFDKIWQHYEKHAHIQHQTYDTLIEKAKKHQPKTIVDIGCASGEKTQTLLNIFPHCKIYGIDYSKNMIKKAELYQNQWLSFKHHAAEKVHNLGRFDLAISNAVYQWSSSLKLALTSLHQAINTAGYLAIYGPETYQELQESLLKLDPKLPKIRSKTFKDSLSIKKILEKIFPNYQLSQTIIRHRYASIWALLQNIQKTGVSSLNHQGYWTKSKINSLEDIYLNQYQGIWASYHIIYCDVFKN